MLKRIIFLMAILSLSVSPFLAQENLFSRNFNHYQGIVPGVDFFADSRDLVKPFEKPIEEARQRLEQFLGEGLAPGAVFICSSVEQQDSVYEPKAFRMGYRWVLMPLTPDAGIQQSLERMKSRMGGEIPPEMLERLKQRASGAESRMVETAVLQVGYAILMTTLNPDKEFRTSRLDDMNRSPLADWLDIGLAAYAARSAESQVSFLQGRLEESFPIEDILFMSRPVIVPTFDAQNSGFSGEGRSRPPNGMGGAPNSPQGQSSRSTAIPKDVQDRRMFDAQAATFFAYLIETQGVEKVREIVQLNSNGEDIQEILERPEFLGTDFQEVENTWREWVGNQKVESRGRAAQSSPSEKPGSK